MEAGFQPLEGRRLEVEWVLGACRSGRVAGVLVTGAAGIGRTRFAREVAAAWSGTVTWVGATESSRTFLFGALSSIVSDLDSDDFGRSAERIVQTLGEGHAPLLLIDDAHLLDAASAAVVHRLAMAAGPVRLLLTTPSGAAGAPRLESIAKDGLLEHVELAPLGAESTIALLEHRLQAPVERATSTRIFQLSGGNPLVVLELVAAGTAEGLLALRGGVWSWRGSVPTSDALARIVERRLGHLDADARRALELVALGEPLGLRELTVAVGSDALAAAEAAGLLTIEQEGRRLAVRSLDQLYTQLVRAQLGRVRTLERLHELDKVLGQVPTRRSADALKRALMRLETGEDHPGDAAILTEASKLARPDYPLAERLARAALERGGGFTAFDYLIDALFWQGRIEEASELAKSVGEFASAEELAYFSLRWSRMRWWMAGEPPAGTDSPAGSDSVASFDLPVDPGVPAATRLATVARQAAMEAAAGRGAAALPIALSVLADDQTEDEGRCWAAGAAMIGLGGDGRVSQALALAPDAYASASRLQDYNYRLLLSVVEVRLRRLSGDLEGARRAVDDLRDSLSNAPDPNTGLVALIEAEIVLATGRALEAVAYIRDAAARLDQLDFGGLSATAHLRLAEALALTGDTVGAEDQLGLARATENRTLALFRPEQLLHKAWIQVGLGSRKLALTALGEARASAAASGERLVELHIHHAGVRLGDHTAARQLLAMSDAVEGSFAAAAGHHAAAWLAHDGAGLVAAADEFAGAGALAHAADAFAQAARVLRQGGDSARSMQLAARAADLAADAGGLHTPALQAALPGLSLTRRQRDVARLAARGMSSREIAVRLGVGVRTVESHLDAAYRRLGVSNRAELTQLWPSG